MDDCVFGTTFMVGGRPLAQHSYSRDPDEIRIRYCGHGLRLDVTSWRMDDKLAVNIEIMPQPRLFQWDLYLALRLPLTATQADVERHVMDNGFSLLKLAPSEPAIFAHDGIRLLRAEGFAGLSSEFTDLTAWVTLNLITAEDFKDEVYGCLTIHSSPGVDLEELLALDSRRGLQPVLAAMARANLVATLTLLRRFYA